MEASDIVMNQQGTQLGKQFETLEDEQLHRKKMLTAGFRLFGKYYTGLLIDTALMISIASCSGSHFWKIRSVLQKK